MKTITRKSKTYDARVRQRVTYRIGQKVFSRASKSFGYIVAMECNGATLRYQTWTGTHCVETAEFVEWHNLRPDASDRWV
jgi:hypothetical protein